MDVLILAPYRYDTAPGQRFRIEQWMPHLEAEGLRFSFDAFVSDELATHLYAPGHRAQKAMYLARDFSRRLVSTLSRRRPDVVFLFRETALIGPALIERILRGLKIPYVFDFDDAIYVPYVSPSNSFFSYLKFPQKTGTSCALASHVFAGNEVLADYARQFTDRISIVPTTIDTAKYRPCCDYAMTGVPTIGWSGSYSSVQYLAALKPVLRELAKQHRFRLEVIGAKFECDGVEVICKDWRAATEVEDLSTIHIGVMPLVDDIWARGKCALKALQYMALGIPTVVSPVGVNERVIRHGDNGLHARSDEDWHAALSQLLGDEALRRRLGQRGVETVEDEYSAKVHAPRVLQVLREAAGR